jgi:hypothetical protein
MATIQSRVTGSQWEHMETTKRSQKLIDINTISIKGAIYHIYIYIYLYLYLFIHQKSVMIVLFELFDFV